MLWPLSWVVPLSPLLGSRVAHNQWKRDKLAELAEVYIGVLAEAGEELERASMGEDATQAAERFIPMGKRLGDAGSRLSLYSSKPLQRAISLNMRRYEDAWLEIQGRTPSQQVHAYWDFLKSAARAREMMRRQLKVY